jgi:hypothetical protein
VLEADLRGRALQVNLDPAIALRDPRSLAQTRIGAGVAGRERQRQSQQQGGKKEGAIHCRYYSEGANDAMEDTTQLRKLTAHVKAAG